MRVPLGWLTCCGLGLLFCSVPKTVAAAGFPFQVKVRFTDSAEPGIDQPAVKHPTKLENRGAGSEDGDGMPGKPWPKPNRLFEQIETLQHVPEFSDWASETVRLLDSISSQDMIASQRRSTLNRLELRQRELPKIVSAVLASGRSPNEVMRQSSEIARLEYRLIRRLAIWNAISRLAQTPSSEREGNHHTPASSRQVSFPDLDPSWEHYLLLDEFKAAFGSLVPNRAQQKKVARQVLARIYSTSLNQEQSTYVQQVIDPGVIAMLKRHASDPADPEALLAKLEQYESHPSARTGYYLNDEYQNLLWSDDPLEQSVAQQVETHFRNANFRMAISERLMNRVIPAMPTTEEPVHDYVQGARVTGNSQVANQVKVRLVPDPGQLSMRLETDGHVRSNTVARTNSFRVLNVGEARFQVVKRLAVGRGGVDSTESPSSTASGNQSVIGVESKFDDIPLVGWLARRLAERKLRDQDRETDQLFRRKVARAAEARVQQEVEDKLLKARQYTHANLIEPMMELDLEPHPYQLATTDKQVVVRYRLAGRDQMSANTARPKDFGDSLLSFQLHQSALNNAIARLGLNGEKFTSEELVEHLRDVIGTQKIGDKDQECQQPAEFSFAHFDPIRVDFIEDRINFVLNLRSLKVGKKGKTWKYLTLTASYRIQSSGMELTLVQDDKNTRIKHKGKRLGLGDKAVIFTVMKVLFKKEYSFNALPKRMSERMGIDGMEVSQLLVSDGWLGVSIDDRQPVAVAGQGKAIPNSRTGAIRRIMNVR